MNFKTIKLNKKPLTLIFTVLFLLSVTTASANPMFGEEVTTSEEDCGDCVCTYATTTTYIFWIPIRSTELTGWDCN
jgi:hypothetical protein